MARETRVATNRDRSLDPSHTQISDLKRECHRLIELIARKSYPTKRLLWVRRALMLYLNYKANR
ncbi:hypothetical protein NIES2104_26510 [Leptolyngbya sp. NIES-2104]|nr:hypothetical protein NIES2104_26510 [Leptolyngbya sp. NIES-2104]